MKIALLGFALFLLPTCASAAVEPVQMPAFSVPTVPGAKGLNLNDYRGKVIYLDFWASWCGPCRTSFKWLNEAHEKYATKGLVIIAMNVDKDKELAAQFLKENPAKFRIDYDPDGGIAQAYQLKGMPSSYMIDRKGQLRATHVGYRVKDKGALEDEIQGLLAE